jgi:integrase
MQWSDWSSDVCSSDLLMVARCLIKFSGNENLKLKDITSELLYRYDCYLIDLGRKLNTVSFHLRNLRAIYNKAVNRGLIPPPKENLFAGLHTGIYKTSKRALTGEEMHALSQLALETAVIEPIAVEVIEAAEVVETPEPATTPPLEEKRPRSLPLKLYRALLYFLFSFHARGIAFIDLVFLMKSNIHGEHIYYVRKKTGKLMSFKITAFMQQILEYFSPLVADSPYLFPIINPCRGNERKQYRTALALQNRRLKIIGQILGISKLLTTHVARHTWATIAKKQHVSLALICECLGHRDEKTTAIYLDSFDNSALDEVSELVSNAI